MKVEEEILIQRLIEEGFVGALDVDDLAGLVNLFSEYAEAVHERLKREEAPSVVAKTVTVGNGLVSIEGKSDDAG